MDDEILPVDEDHCKIFASDALLAALATRKILIFHLSELGKVVDRAPYYSCRDNDLLINIEFNADIARQIALLSLRYCVIIINQYKPWRYGRPELYRKINDEVGQYLPSVNGYCSLADSAIEYISVDSFDIDIVAAFVSADIRSRMIAVGLAKPFSLIRSIAHRYNLPFIGMDTAGPMYPVPAPKFTGYDPVPHFAEPAQLNYIRALRDAPVLLPPTNDVEHAEYNAAATKYKHLADEWNLPNPTSINVVVLFGAQFPYMEQWAHNRFPGYELHATYGYVHRILRHLAGTKSRSIVIVRLRSRAAAVCNDLLAEGYFPVTIGFEFSQLDSAHVYKTYPWIKILPKYIEADILITSLTADGFDDDDKIFPLVPIDSKLMARRKRLPTNLYQERIRRTDTCARVRARYRWNTEHRRLRWPRLRRRRRH